MIRPQVAAVAAILAGALAACGSSREPPPPLPVLTATVPLKTASRLDLGRQDDRTGGPIRDGDRIFVAGTGGALAALEAGGTRVLWRVETKAPLTGAMGSGGGLVVVASRKGRLLAYDYSGKALWQVDIGSEAGSSPAVSQAIVVVRTVDGKIIGLSPADGARRWSITRSMPVLFLHEAGDPVATGDAVYVPFPGGKLLALEPGTGRLLWEAAASLPKGATELERISDITGAPLVDDRMVCAVSFQGRLACFDRTTGGFVWAQDVPSPYGMTQNGGTIFVTDERGSVRAFRKSDGAPVWSQDKLRGRGLTAPAVNERSVVVGDIEGYVHFLDPANGEFVSRIATDGSPVLSRVVAFPGGAVVATLAGSVVPLLGP